MSSSHKSRKASASDPIFIDLKRTHYGYEIVPPKSSHTISLSKNMLTKTGKASRESKDGTSRALQKETFPPVQTPSHKSASSQAKSKSAVKPSNIPVKNTIPPPSVTKERIPVVHEVEIKRREIFPFIGFTLPGDTEPEAHQVGN